MIDALRTAAAVAFRKAPRQAIVRPSYEERPSSAKRFRRDLLSLRGALTLLVVVPVLWLVWTYALPFGRPEHAMPLPAANVTPFDPQALDMHKAQLSSGPLWVSTAEVNDALYHMLMPTLDGLTPQTAAPVDRPAQVSYAEAVNWCDLYGRFERSAHSEFFGPGGPGAALTFRLPAFSEWRELRQKGLVPAADTAPLEWVFQDAPPEHWADLVQTAPAGRLLSAIEPRVGFHVVLGPRSETKATADPQSSPDNATRPAHLPATGPGAAP